MEFGFVTCFFFFPFLFSPFKFLFFFFTQIFLAFIFPYSTPLYFCFLDSFSPATQPLPQPNNFASSRMDPSPSAEPSSASEPSRRQGRNRGRANQNQPDTEDASKNKGRRGNNNNKGNNKDKDNHRNNNSNKSSHGANGNPRAPQTIAATDPIDLHPGRASAVASTTQDDESEQHSCFICTENIVIFAVSDCNHRTCHLCSLRLRALYKTKNCAFCKASRTFSSSVSTIVGSLRYIGCTNHYHVLSVFLIGGSRNYDLYPRR